MNLTPEIDPGGAPGAVQPPGSYLLALYLVPGSQASRRAVANVRAICDELLPDRYTLEVIDLREHPELTRELHLLAAPTLIKKQPPPEVRLIGDLSNRHEVLAALGLTTPTTSPPAGSYSDLVARLAAAEGALDAVAAGAVDALASEHPAGAQMIGVRDVDRFFRTLVTQMQEATASLDSTGTVLYANPRFAELVGLTLTEVLGRTLTELTGKPAQEGALALLAEAEHGPTRHALELLRADGHLVPVSVSAAPLAPGGDEICLVVTDLTERNRLLSEKTAANDGLLAANETMRDFIAVASHDLRTPIAVIAGYAELLTRDWATLREQDKREFLDVIDRQSRHLAALTSELLEVSRIESGELDTRPEPVGLREAIGRSLEAVGQDGANVSVSCPPDLVVLVDPLDLARILENYLTNAAKYGEPPVRIEATRGRDAVEVRVIDHGPGVPPEFVPRLFDKFARADTPTTKAHSGTGLGLSIACGLAEANGGQTSYEPNSPTGSCFHVHLRPADNHQQGTDPS